MLHSRRLRFDRIRNMQLIKTDDEIIQNFEKITKEKDETIKNLEKMVQNLEEMNKEKERILQILCLGEFAQSIKILIRLKLLNNKDKEITSLVQLDEMVEEGSKFLTKNEIKKWGDFRKKLESGKYQVNQIDDALKLALQWRDSLAQPKNWPVTLSKLAKLSRMEL